METLFQSNVTSNNGTKVGGGLPQTRVKIASWNVNSIRARLPVFIPWVKEYAPEILLLQETKCEDKDFPLEIVEDFGYNVAHFGQKTFNGVAILSKFPLEDIKRGLLDFDDPQRRFIEAGISINGHYLKVASVYVPNGQEVGSEKYAYKLQFLNALHAHMKQNIKDEEMCIFAGDYNIAPRDKDTHDPLAWHEQILCSTPERHAFNGLLNLGYTDIFACEDPVPFTWWDYRAGSFFKNHGLRIDHILASSKAADHVVNMHVDKDVRGMDKTSDHAPVCVEIEF